MQNERDALNVLRANLNELRGFPIQYFSSAPTFEAGRDQFEKDRSRINHVLNATRQFCSLLAHDELMKKFNHDVLNALDVHLDCFDAKHASNHVRNLINIRLYMIACLTKMINRLTPASPSEVATPAFFKRESTVAARHDNPVSISNSSVHSIP